MPQAGSSGLPDLPEPNLPLLQPPTVSQPLPAAPADTFELRRWEDTEDPA